MQGDQASIVGGAINFVKELEQLLQSLEANKRLKKDPSDTDDFSRVFSDFFTFPQYSTHSTTTAEDHEQSSMAAKRQSISAEVEVTMIESHANLKILTRRHPKQLLKMVVGLYSLCLSILHLNITSVDQMVLYSFSVKVSLISLLSFFPFRNVKGLFLVWNLCRLKKSVNWLLSMTLQLLCMRWWLGCKRKLFLITHMIVNFSFLPSVFYLHILVQMNWCNLALILSLLLLLCYLYNFQITVCIMNLNPMRTEFNFSPINLKITIII